MTKNTKGIYKVNVQNIGLVDLKKQKRVLQKVVALIHVFPEDFITAINGALELYNKLTPKDESSLAKNTNYTMENIQVSVKDMKIQKWNILKLSDIKHPILTKEENKELDGILNLFDYIQDDCIKQGAKIHDTFSLPKLGSEKEFEAKWNAEMEALNNYIKDFQF